MVKSRRTMFDNAKNPLILQTKFEDFQRYTHEALFQFPKKERFLLCGQIQTATDEAMQLIIRFRLKYYKKTTLEDIIRHRAGLTLQAIGHGAHISNRERGMSKPPARDFEHSQNPMRGMTSILKT